MSATQRRIALVAGAAAALAGLSAILMRRRERIASVYGTARERVAAIASRNGDLDAVEEASEESFPASDAPGFGGAGL